MVELLSPVGDFDCLKAAVQNGANAVYFGGQLFNARYSAKNFDKDGIREAVNYAKSRNVKINFTLNILLKNNEFDDAIDVVKYIYELGVDAVIVDDLGFAKYIIDNFPGMEVHGSTQMTIHNLDGAIALKNLGYSRVVLARESTLSDIDYICRNANIDIEAFVHGALCISYSGQCLFSSAIGGRSGNRGRCAQPCRMYYNMLETSDNVSYKNIGKGFLISPRDLCGLDFIPDLIKAGVKSFKLEGRMKTPEYVAIVTRIYRKYIDLALSDNEYVVDKNDLHDLMLAFNRGGFSKGCLGGDDNHDYVFEEKPSNQGLYIGNISKIDKKNGLISLKTNEPLNIGDTFLVQQEDHKYTISEILKNGSHVKSAAIGDLVTIGRVKGKLELGDKVFKINSSIISKEIKEFNSHEHVKIPLVANFKALIGKPLELEVVSLDEPSNTYFGLSTTISNEIQPIEAISNPISKERLIEQLNKTTDTNFEFKKINIEMNDNIYIPKISSINALRRDAINALYQKGIDNFTRILPSKLHSTKLVHQHVFPSIRTYSVLLNSIDISMDYSSLKNVDRVYIPLKFFIKKEFESKLLEISQFTDCYIDIPTIVRDNFRNVFYNNFDEKVNKFNIKGLVISNLSGIEFMMKYVGKLDIVSKYTLNIYNNHTIDELKKVGINRVTVSPELDTDTLIDLCNNSSLPTEFLVYGKLPVMHIQYCPLGKSNKCYPTCSMKCKTSNRFYLEDKLGYKFEFVPDNMQTITKIYNSKINSIDYAKFPFDSCLISITDEDNLDEIIYNVKNNIKFEGKNYTNGNLNKFV
nr:DUF3656 domain-containing protein [Clostridiales bacterium]